MSGAPSEQSTPRPSKIPSNQPAPKFSSMAASAGRPRPRPPLQGSPPRRKRSFCERHRGCNFMWKAMLVLLPMAGVLFASLFIIWRHDDCGPKYPNLCGSEKDNMVTLFAWTFATCVLLVAVPFCSACFFSYFKNLRLIPNEAVGLICYVSAMATAIGALYYYFNSSIVFSDGLFTTSDWGQWLFVIPIFGIFLVAILWVVRTAREYRRRVAREQALRLSAVIVEDGGDTDDEPASSTVVDQHGAQSELPPKLGILKYTQNWASKSLNNVVHGALRVFGPSRDDKLDEEPLTPKNGHSSNNRSSYMGDETSGPNVSDDKNDSSSSIEASLVAEPALSVASPRSRLGETSPSSNSPDADNTLMSENRKKPPMLGQIPQAGSRGSFHSRSFYQKEKEREVAELLESDEPEDTS